MNEIYSPGSSIFSLCKKFHKISSLKCFCIFSTIFLRFFSISWTTYCRWMRPPYRPCMMFRLVLTSFHPVCSSSHLNFSVHYAMIFTFGDSGHISISSIELRSRFAPAIRRLSSLNHEMDRGPLLMSGPRKPCVIFWNGFLISISDLHFLQRRMWLHLPVYFPGNPPIAFDFSYSHFICTIPAHIWPCLARLSQIRKYALIILLWLRPRKHAVLTCLNSPSLIFHVFRQCETKQYLNNFIESLRSRKSLTFGHRTLKE